LCREKYEKLVSITIQKYRGKKSNLSTARSVVIAVRFSPSAIPDRQPFPALCPTMALRPLQYVFSHLGTLADSWSWRCFPNAVQTEDAILFFGGFYPSYSIGEHVPGIFRRIFQISSKKVKSIRSCASL